jgi:hypothetical protein
MTHSARPWALGIGAVALGALLLGACSSSSNPSTATSSPSATTPGGTSSGSSGLGALSSEAASAEHATFSATYTVMTSTNTGGPQTVTIEQDPPASVFKTGSGSYINTGTKTYYCASTSGSGVTCLETSQTTNPLAGLLTLFNPSTAVAAMQSAEAEASSHLAGYSVTTSSGSYGGESAQCADISAAGHSAKYCVTSAGILAYEGSDGNSFSLTNYSSSVSPSDFAVPAGATIENVPSSP